MSSSKTGWSIAKSIRDLFARVSDATSGPIHVVAAGSYDEAAAAANAEVEALAEDAAMLDPESEEYQTRMGKRQDASGLTYLMSAARDGNAEYVAMLIPSSDMSMTDKQGMNALMHAVAGGHVEAAKHLLNLTQEDREDALRTRDTTSKTPLMIAAMNGHAECVAMMLADGPLEAIDKSGFSAADLARRSGRVDIAIAIEAFNPSGALTSAMHFNDPIEVARIVKRYDPFTRKGDGKIMLIWAVQLEHENCLAALLQSPTAKSIPGIGTSALLLAATRGKTACARLLIPFSNVAFKNNMSRTALMLAAERGWTDVVDLLIPHSDCASKSKHKGMNALMFAAMGGHVGCVQSLIKVCDPMAKNKDGDNVAEVARKAGQRDLSASLQIGLRRAEGVIVDMAASREKIIGAKADSRMPIKPPAK